MILRTGLRVQGYILSRNTRDRMYPTVSPLRVGQGAGQALKVRFAVAVCFLLPSAKLAVPVRV